MRILIDIGHPGHVHLFRPFAREMEKRGHALFFTFRQKECEEELLQAARLSKRSFGRHYSSPWGKLWGLAKFNGLMLRAIREFKPGLLLSHGSIYAAQMAWLAGWPHIALEDTGNWEQVRLYLPFTQCVLTSNTFPEYYGEKQVRYNGHHELAYLHPSRFKPDEQFRHSLPISPDTPYALLRFVSWKATHDIGQKGLSPETKRQLIELLSARYRVFISSEAPLPAEYESYRVHFPADKMHDAIYYASLFIGEGTTTAMEAAILGTPSVYVNSQQYANIEDLAKYGLIFSFPDDELVVQRVKKLLQRNGLKHEWSVKRDEMLKHKIDVTAFLVWFIESWPESFSIMKANPAYQDQFHSSTIA